MNLGFTRETSERREACKTTPPPYINKNRSTYIEIGVEQWMIVRIDTVLGLQASLGLLCASGSAGSRPRP